MGDRNVDRLNKAFGDAVARLSGEVSAQAAAAWDNAKDKRVLAGRLLSTGSNVWSRGAELAMAYFRLRMALEFGYTVPSVFVAPSNQPKWYQLGDLVAEFESVAGVPAGVAVVGAKRIGVSLLKAGAVSLRDKRARDVQLITDRFEDALASVEAGNEDKVRSLFAGTMEHLAAAGYRQLITDVAPRSGQYSGWARVSRTGKPCAWCAMLISRGPVYHNEATATTRRARGIGKGGGSLSEADNGHPHCQCYVVPVKSRAEWLTGDLFSQGRQFQSEWVKGMSLKDWRKQYYQIRAKQWRDKLA